MIAVFLCSLVERYSEFASLIVFLGMFAGNFVIAWKVALYVTERYLLTAEQRRRNEEHAEWAGSLWRTIK